MESKEQGWKKRVRKLLHPTLYSSISRRFKRKSASSRVQGEEMGMPFGDGTMRTAMARLAMAFMIAIVAAGAGSSNRANAADVIIGAGEESRLHFNVGRALCRAS